MKLKFLLLNVFAVIGIFMIHGCSEDYYFDEDFDSLAERRITRSITESTTGVQYSYPDVRSIAGDATVKDQMAQAWKLTVDNCTEAGRCEYGFFIYINHLTGKFYCDNIVPGDMVDNSTINNGSIALGRCSNNLEVCAFFHTHTSLEHYTIQGFRKTGPTDADRAAAESYGIPGILYDYKASIIKTGDSKTADSDIYYITPPDKRADIDFYSDLTSQL